MLQRLVAGVAIAAVAALALVGCTPEEPTETTPPATPSPSVNEQQLSAAARASWDRYQVRISELGADPSSANLDTLLEVATPDVASFLLDNFEAAADRRIHTEGERETTAFQLVDFSDAPQSITAVACVDVSRERIVADEGGDFTLEQDPLQESEVTLALSQTAGVYVVASESTYEGPEEASPC